MVTSRDVGEPGANERAGLAVAADGLTLARLVIAVALVPVLGSGRVALGATLVGTAWLTDFFDGRAARAARGAPTRLGGADLYADTAVGAGIVLGFTAWGWIPPALGLAVALVLFAWFVRSRNEALSMVLQATGYGLLLWRTWRDDHTLSLWWLLSLIAAIAIVNRRVFWERSLPTFLGGIGALLRDRPRA